MSKHRLPFRFDLLALRPIGEKRKTWNGNVLEFTLSTERRSDEISVRIELLMSVLGGLKTIDADSLARTDVLGKDLSFKDGVPTFKRTLALFAELSECNLDNTPAESLNQITQLAQQAWNGFQAIQTFSLAQYASNPVAQRDQLVAQIRDQ